jgi:hypothetical protein
MSKLGICISPFMGLRLARLAEFAHESENAGIEGIFIPEGENDGLICCYAAAKATNRVMVATWIVNIVLLDARFAAALLLPRSGFAREASTATREGVALGVETSRRRGGDPMALIAAEAAGAEVRTADIVSITKEGADSRLANCD